MKKMKAVRIKEPGNVEIIEQEIPTRKKNEALLKIKYCGICGSDIATYTGNQPFATYPRIPGHEFSAEIVEIDKNGFGLEPGMIVTANPYFNCGKCYPCSKGLLNCCENNETMGVQRDGAFAEYITMPIEKIYYGKGLPEKILALIEPFSIGYHASVRGNIQPGENVLVVGAGPIGLFAMISAKLKGAKVYITDLKRERLNYAKKLGADDIINSTDENLKEKVMKITHSNGMDVCIEAVGISDTFLDCLENVAFSGKVILIGNGKTESSFNHSVLVKKELNVFGSRNSLKDMAALIDLVSITNMNLDYIVSDIFELDDATKAFELLGSSNKTAMKVLVKF
ncbi:theronine dehydrogenase-like Zn-dependent dehydrogenase [Tepidanaerobacter syntrophicus]|uniref:zinc-binding alcohol dehydrogenase family protein n=1 Tax=Tepidanaerobacter syntrophicus TaxID=224999 RepID=UPI0022EF4C7E|nr:zinc-binding alcohol dehydrogenase family protein [Tepidanaerobacter syntrophicus]GLI18279.1 theronine dehydrogenase-like Zn-dependent dehydrogenase [Tepidanaerobacter syntrophicus]